MFQVNAQGLLDEFLNLQPIAHQIWIANKNVTSFHAWREAIRRTQTRKPMRDRFSIQNLLPVLRRHGAFNGATTSGVEQSLSKFQADVPADRTLSVHWLQEHKLISDLGCYDKEALCAQAREEWTKRFAAPRKFAEQPRLHKGLPMSKRKQEQSQTAFVKRRRLHSKQAALVPMQEPLA